MCSASTSLLMSSHRFSSAPTSTSRSSQLILGLHVTSATTSSSAEGPSSSMNSDMSSCPILSAPLSVPMVCASAGGGAGPEGGRVGARARGRACERRRAARRRAARRRGGAWAWRQRGARARRRRGGALGFARIFIDIPTSILGWSIREGWKAISSDTVLDRLLIDGGSRPRARCARSGNIWSSTASGRSCVRSCERDAAPPDQQRA